MAEDIQNSQIDDITDTRFKEFVINAVVPFPVILAQADLPRYDYTSKVYCPFHENTDTPAAKIYKFETGDVLKCYSEGKSFRPVDVIKHGLLKANIHTVFHKIWQQLSEDTKDRLTQLYDKPIDVIPTNWKEMEEELNQFRANKLTIQQFIPKLIQATATQL